jgi:tetratricopeptide (TPR) repeat protein
LYGVFYAEFLISIKRPSEALELTQANLKICQEENLPADISRCHRTLSTIERAKKNYNNAKAQLQKSLEIAKKIGMPDLETEALLESCRLHLDKKKYESAIQNANEVLKICFRTGFKFYEPEAELILARAHLALKEIVQARTFAQSAYEKATEMHYHSPKIEAKQLLSTLKK